MGYDVFLSHNSLDKPHVRALHSWLSRSGVRCFLDEADLEPGDVLTDALGKAMDDSASAVICIGGHGEGPWHGEEMNTLLGRSLRMARTQNEFRLIPVLLPDADTSHMRWFLQTRMWVNLSGGITDADAELHRLKAAILGERGAPISPDPGFNPYRGLEAFHPEDASFFFGRAKESAELAEKLSRARFCAITGPSGNGKSSLARAGLNTEAALRVCPALSRWKQVTVKPGQGFLRSLLLQLHSHLPPEERNPLVEAAITSVMPPTGLPTAEAWAGAVDQHLQAFYPAEDETVLLLVDQFEEIFTHRSIGSFSEKDRLDRARLVLDGIAALREKGTRRWRILLTMRSDFLQRCRISDSFWNLLEKNHLRLELDELNEDGWREAIKGPASRAGAYLEAGLVEIMLKDVYRQRGSMPLLQLALQSLWNLRDGACLTHAAYTQIGGVANALNQRAETCLASLKNEDPEYHDIARNLLMRLVSPGEGVGDTRRRADRRELEWEKTEPAFLARVLEELTSSENRLVMTDGDSIEIVHEVLIRDCPSIRAWIELARPEIPILRRLTHAARRWEDSGRDAIFLNPADPPRELKLWIQRATLRITPLEQEFWRRARAARSLMHREKRQTQRRLREEQEERVKVAEAARVDAQKAELRVRRRSWIAIAVAVVAIGMTVMVAVFWNEAENSKSEAQKALADSFFHRISDATELSIQEEDAMWELMHVSINNKAVSDILLEKWFDTFTEESPMPFSKNGFAGLRSAATLSRISDYSGKIAGRILEDMFAKEVNFYFEISGHAEAIRGLPPSAKDTEFAGQLLDKILNDRQPERIPLLGKAFESIPNTSLTEDLILKIRSAAINPETGDATREAIFGIINAFPTSLKDKTFSNEIRNALLSQGGIFHYSSAIDEAVEFMPAHDRDTILASTLLDQMFNEQEKSHEFLESLENAIALLPNISIDSAFSERVKSSVLSGTNEQSNLTTIGRLVGALPEQLIDPGFVDSLLKVALEKDYDSDQYFAVVEALKSLPVTFKDKAFSTRILETYLTRQGDDLHWRAIGEIVNSLPPPSIDLKLSEELLDSFLRASEDEDAMGRLFESGLIAYQFARGPEFSERLFEIIYSESEMDHYQRVMLIDAFDASISNLTSGQVSDFIDRCIYELPPEGASFDAIDHEVMLDLAAYGSDLPSSIYLWALDIRIRQMETYPSDSGDIPALCSKLAKSDIAMLVDVLKWPICNQEAQAYVLEAIENSARMSEQGAEFNGNLWTFLEQASRLGIENLGTPTTRPTLDAVVTDWRRWRSAHPDDSVEIK